MQGILKLDLEVSSIDFSDILHLVDWDIFEIDVTRKGEEHVLKWTFPRKLQLFFSKSSAGQMKILQPGDFWKRQMTCTPLKVYTLWGIRKKYCKCWFFQARTSYHLYSISKYLHSVNIVFFHVLKNMKHLSCYMFVKLNIVIPTF